MTDKKRILLNAFSMNSVGHIHHGLWAHPRDRSADYGSLAYWTGLARTLERGLFDGLFIADIIGHYDVYQGDLDITLRESVQLPVNDPWVLVSAMAAATSHLGFGVTANVGAEHPYTFARRVSTLDQLTGGRIGWNIVTGYLDSGARGLGQDALAEHDARYDRADDFLALSYKLWEGSWADDAVRNDAAARRYADPDKVRAIAHDGPFYRTHAAHMSAPTPQRTPVLYQAGASDRGRRFAGSHAECVFIAAADPASARKTARALRQAAADAGRDPSDLKIFVGLAVVPGRTQAEAQARHAEYLQYASPEAGLAHFSASTGIDFSRYGLDEAIAYGPSNAIQSATQAAQQRSLTRRQLLAQFALGGRYSAVVGDAVHVADELERWIDEGEIDGFNLTRIVVPETWEDFIDIVVPELQNRGRYRTAYEPGSLRHRIFGKGDRLPDTHPAARARHVDVAARTGATLEATVESTSASTPA